MWSSIRQPPDTTIQVSPLSFLSYSHLQALGTYNHLFAMFLPPAIRRMGEGNSFSLFTFRRGGGVTRSSLGRGEGGQSQIFFGGGGVPCLRFSGGGGSGWSQVSDFRGGAPRSQISGGAPRSQIFRGGYPVSVKGKNFWYQIWLDTCSDWEKFFCRGTPPPPQ